MSVRNQSFENVEYIIVDGNSNDGTLKIIQDHPDTINTYVSEPDKGLYDAMNKGISMATGDLIGILNADDTFHHDTVLEEVAAFHHNNSIEASVGNIIQHDKTGKVKRVYSAKNWNPEKLKVGFMPAHPAIFFKRELFEKFGNYHLDFTIGADYELITRFFLKNGISWQYSGITTTSMLVGGLSSSGISSYKLISTEIAKALSRNGIKFSKLRINNRWVWKLVGFINKK
ncbi:putative glycosyl transferase [Nonlabens marinus S1-08]|uniref:Putative glycosyl transferase n=1 Tax=Nonlabens marinus S1-08 TaxID=1454201 RepID=W8VS93_9FLAO|nr:putative glycosyl transferase [Nonlabens marinus S1-08]